MGKKKLNTERGVSRESRSIWSPSDDDRSFAHFSATETDIGNGQVLVNQMEPNRPRQQLVNQHQKTVSMESDGFVGDDERDGTGDDELTPVEQKEAGPFPRSGTRHHPRNMSSNSSEQQKLEQERHRRVHLRNSSVNETGNEADVEEDVDRPSKHQKQQGNVKSSSHQNNQQRTQSRNTDAGNRRPGREGGRHKGHQELEIHVSSGYITSSSSNAASPSTAASELSPRKQKQMMKRERQREQSRTGKSGDTEVAVQRNLFELLAIDDE